MAVEGRLQWGRDREVADRCSPMNELTTSMSCLRFNGAATVRSRIAHVLDPHQLALI